MDITKTFGLSGDSRDPANLPQRMEFLCCVIAAIKRLEYSKMIALDDPHILMLRGPVAGVLLAYFTEEQVNDIERRRDKDVNVLAAEMMIRCFKLDDITSRLTTAAEEAVKH